jgi:hypothetical protein
VDVDLKNDYNRMELEEIVQVNQFNSPLPLWFLPCDTLKLL